MASGGVLVFEGVVWGLFATSIPVEDQEKDHHQDKGRSSDGKPKDILVGGDGKDAFAKAFDIGIQNLLVGIASDDALFEIEFDLIRRRAGVHGDGLDPTARGDDQREQVLITPNLGGIEGGCFFGLFGSGRGCRRVWGVGGCGGIVRNRRDGILCGWLVVRNQRSGALCGWMVVRNRRDGRLCGWLVVRSRRSGALCRCGGGDRDGLKS